MTDRELLEAAAKAAGLHEPTTINGRFCVRTRNTGMQDWSPWNPLTDDGDALRLAVKVLNWPHGGRAFANEVSSMFAVGKLPSDPYAATRRAIVRAAAAIGGAS